MSAVNHAQFTAVDAQIDTLVLSSALTAPVSVPWPQRTTDFDDVATTAPTADQVLAYDGVGSEWAPATLAVAAVKDSIFISASAWTSGGATSPAVRHWATVSAPQYNGAGATTFTVSTDASNGGEKYITLNQAGQYTVFASSDKTTDDDSWLQIDQRNAAGAIVQSVRSDDNAAALGTGHRFSLKPLFNCIATDTLHVSIRNLSVVGGSISTADNANFLSIVREGDMAATPRVVTHQEAVLSLSPSPFIYYPLDTDSTATLVSLGSLGTGYNATINATCYSERHIRQRPTANGGKVLDIGAHYPVETHRIYCDGTVNTSESLMPYLGSDSWGCSLWFRFSDGAALTASRSWFVSYGYQSSVSFKSRGMGFTPDGNVWVGARGIFNSYSTGSVDIGDGRWHHMAGHVSGKITVCYLDGVLIGTTGFNNNYLDAVNGTPIVIGGEEAYPADTHFIGELSHVAMRKAPWTQSEVSLLYSKRPVEDDEGATTLGLRVEYDASDVDGAGTPAATTGATQSIVNLAWPGTHDGTMYNSSGTTAVADAGMSTTSHPWAFSFARAAGAGDSRIEFADSYSMSFNDASTNYMTAEFVLRFTSLASAQRLFAEIGTGGERHNLGVLADGSVRYDYSGGADVYYRADNVDGVGTPGNGSTTTLVNLANPGTYDATIINGTGVSQDVTQAGTPYEYAINMTENLTYGLGSFLRVGGLGTNFTFTSELYHTVELWLKHDGTTTQMYSECVNGSADYKNARYFSGSTDLYHQHSTVSSGSNNVFVGTTNFSSIRSGYNQIVMVRNGSTYSYYVNGAFSLSNTPVTPIGTYNGAAPNLTYIGAIYSSVASPNMNGKLCVAKLYDRALDADEVARRYASEFAGPQVVTANTWQHIAAVTDNGNLTVYYDGSVAHAGPYEGSTTLSALTTTLIGTASGDTDAFNCDIAVARFYNRPLSLAEVQANYVAAMRTAVVPQPVAGAVVYYRADNVDGAGNPGSGATTTLVNLANPGTYNGTINNSAAGVVSQPDFPSPWNYGVSLDTLAFGTAASHIQIGDGFLTNGGAGDSANIRSTHEFWLLPTDLPSGVALGYLYGEVNTPTDTVFNVNYFLTESFVGTFAIAHTPDGASPFETYSANNVWKYNQFVQIVIVNNGGTLTFYVNGASVGSVAMSAYTGRVTTGCIARIGCRGDALSNTILEGTMSAVLIYDRVLSATEVALNYATLRGTASPVSGAVVHYRADNVDGAGTPGDAGTTTLVNLANPGTYDGVINAGIAGGGGVEQDVGQAGTPFEYGVKFVKDGVTGVVDADTYIHVGSSGPGYYFAQGGVSRLTAWTIELWMKIDSVDSTNWGAIYTECVGGGSGDYRHRLGYYATYQLWHQNSPNSFPVNVSVANPYDSQYEQRVITVDSSSYTRLYINGVLAQTIATAPNSYVGGTIANSAIGMINSGTSSFGWTGKVCIARIYDQTLSAEEVYANYFAEINA